MEYIVHRSYKYIKKVRTKSGKWRYIYARPHGRTTGSSSGQAEVQGRNSAFDEYQKWEAQDQAKRDLARKANTSSNYNDINWSETRNGYTYTHGDKALREKYPWRYNKYYLPVDSHNAENSRKRRLAAAASTEGRRKEQMAERKTHKNTEKFLNTLYKMPLGGLLKLYVEKVKKKK